MSRIRAPPPPEVQLDAVGNDYRLGSQYAHATHFATGLYRKHLGVDVETGDFATTAMWRTPLALSWFALETPTARLLECVGGGAVEFRDALPDKLFAEAIAGLPQG